MQVSQPKPVSKGFAFLRRAGPSGAYSIDKLLALDQYTTTTSPWRVAAVLVATPTPGLLGALLPAFVPMQDPLSPLGARANPGYFVCSFTITTIVVLGMLLHWRAGGELPRHIYTNWQVVAVSVASAIPQFAFVCLLAFLWRFPMPMSWIVVSSTTGASVALGHLLIFGDRCHTDAVLIEGIKRYIPALVFQSIQILLYPAFSVLFDHVTSLYQVLLTLAFPLVKYAMKKGLRKHTHGLKDFSNEVAVTGIEICASLYQSMILQNAPSRIALVIIMAFDVLQGLLAVKFFLDRPSQLSQHQIVDEALKQLRAARSAAPAVDASSSVEKPYSQTVVVPFHAIPSIPHKSLDAQSNHATPPSEKQPTPVVSNKTTKVPRQANPQLVTNALELAHVAESILLVEYIEVAIPLVNAVFISIACQFNGAQYNTRLRRLYFHSHALASAVQSIVLYSLLQALSFVAMHVVMRYRYGMSATYHLAFVLEHHWESIVGKMISWLPIILHFTGIHYGVDFSFRFDFAAMLRSSENN